MMNEQSTRAYGFHVQHRIMTFFTLLRPHWLRLLLGSLVLLCTNAVFASLPMIINAGVNAVKGSEPAAVFIADISISLGNITYVVISIICLAFFGAVLRTVSRMVLFDVGRLIERDVRAALFFHVSLLDEDYYSRVSIGNIMNHLTSDVSNVRMVVGFVVLNILNIVYVFSFAVPLLVHKDPLIAAAALLPFPLIALSMSGITRSMFVATMEYQQALSNMVSHVQENLLGAQVVKAFHRQEQEGDRFFQANDKTFYTGMRVAKYRMLMMPIMRLLVGISVGLVLYVGGSAVLEGRISLGDFVEINARIVQLAWPAMSVGFVMSIVSRGQASLKRINDVLVTMPTLQDGTQELSQVDRINVKNLAFAHAPKQAQSTISFEITMGSMMALVGPSGSFKSSVLRALSRRCLVPKQSVCINDVDINDLKLESLYKNISFVQQEPLLFGMTILDNLRFYNPSASEREIDEVVKLLALDRDMEGFLSGIHTVVGERGVSLSGGQRQRIAIGRALLAKHPILLLDDALSAVDKETERHIVSHIKPFLKNMMVIASTHRLSLCTLADSIMVLDKGHIVEMGSHEALIHAKGMYRTLWDVEHQPGISS